MHSRSIVILSLSIALGVCLPQLAFTQTGHCTINGKIINKGFNDVVYLVKGDRPRPELSDATIIDSVATDKGRFRFRFPLSHTDFYAIRLGRHFMGFVMIASPNDKINITCDTAYFYAPKITGSTENVMRNKYHADLKPLIVKMNSYGDSTRFAKNDTALYNRYVAQNVFWAGQIRQYNLRFINRHPHTLVSLDMYNTYYELFPDSAVKRYLSNLPKALRNNPMANEIAYKKFQEKDDLQKIKKFYDLRFFDTAYRPIDFKKYAGNLVLIDFWASWCVPCIANMPIIDSIYQKNIGKPFKILSISLDETINRWKKGVTLYPVAWDNASDLKGIKGLAAKYYHIKTIPRYILLDTDGNTLASDVPIAELDQLITQYLTNKK
jgi:thiol-disulfide isomerase/thioredoxin